MCLLAMWLSADACIIYAWLAWFGVGMMRVEGLLRTVLLRLCVGSADSGYSSVVGARSSDLGLSLSLTAFASEAGEPGALSLWVLGDSGFAGDWAVGRESVPVRAFVGGR